MKNEVKDLPKTIFFLVVLCAVAYFLNTARDAETYEYTPEREPSACIYLEKSYANGSIDPEGRDYYETYC